MNRYPLALPITALVLTLSACTSDDSTQRSAEPTEPAKPAPAAAPAVLKWGQKAKVAGIAVTVDQPIYGKQVRDEGPQASYTITITNQGKTDATAMATHYADGTLQPTYSDDTDELAETSIAPGTTATVEQITTVPSGTKTFTVNVEMRPSEKPADVQSRKWRGTITGQPTSAAPEPEATPKAAPESIYTCEPEANARFDDPDNPNVITNKSCPDINAERSRAQQEYADQLERDAESPHNKEDANGETYAEYCARTGQPLDTCAAG